MDSITNSSSKCSNSSTDAIEVDSDNRFLTKLRRLKIGESLLSKSINKSMKTLEGESEVLLNIVDYKEFETKVKNTYMDINTLFCDVKANTCTQDNFKLVDVDDIKGDVLELEAKIKKFKTFLKSELELLKNKEQELQKQVYENPCRIENFKWKRKIASKSYNIIVSSPVKTLIKSPFKCLEVQKFQDFMANSKNRYGGWNAYSHNLFEISWQKYFSLENDEIEKFRESNFEKSHLFQRFMRDILQKLPGLTADDIVLHFRWYSEFIVLKRLQQKALEKWRSKKQIIKKVQFTKEISDNIKENSENFFAKKHGDRNSLNTLVSDKFKEMNVLLPDSFPDNDNVMKNEYMKEKLFKNDMKEQTKSVYHVKYASDEMSLRCNPKVEGNDKYSNVLGFLKPTVQWNNRCESVVQDNFLLSNSINVETLSRRRIPDWRRKLLTE